MTSRNNTYIIFAADSRANNFGTNLYRPPPDLDINFIIRRGAKILDLLPDISDALQQAPSHKRIIVKVAAGINNITRLTRTNRGQLITFGQTSSQQILNQYRELRQHIHRICPSAIVGFVSVATASVRKYQDFFCTEHTLLDDQEITREQGFIDTCVDEINRGIRRLNARGQAGYGRGPLCILWNTYIRSTSKRRNRNRRPVTTIRNSFNRLYDGLHPTSDLKAIWFDGLCHVLRQEIAQFDSEDRETIQPHQIPW